MKFDLTSIPRFEVYWWIASDSPGLDRYATKNAGDIERFSATHVRIHAKPLERDDIDDLEIILRQVNGKWMVKCDLFEDASEDYPFAFGNSDSGLIWTDAQLEELMVIKGCTDS